MRSPVANIPFLKKDAHPKDKTFLKIKLTEETMKRNDKKYHRRWRQHRAITVDTVDTVDAVDTVDTFVTVDTVDTV